MSFRVIDGGTISWLDSQVIYHAVASAISGTSEPTLTLVSPSKPYICIGYHQELEKEVDVDFCRANDLPITRRQVGGGAVYLDGNQLFWHIIVPRSQAPYRIEDVYTRYLAGPVNALRKMGIPAVHRPVNDIQVEGRKIGGTGAATIGDAIVIVGSLIFDFDYETMVRVLKVPSEKFRDKVYHSMREYLTTIRRELGSNAPTWEQGKQILIEEIAKSLSQDAYLSKLSESEQIEMSKWRAMLTSDEWLYQAGGLRHKGLKIAEGVHVREAAHKAPGGLIRATVVAKDRTLDNLALSGDFFIFPDYSLPGLESALTGSSLIEQELHERSTAYWQDNKIQSPGLAPADVAKVVLLAANE
ncbi:MAG TPA: biotin/lipoate A/B protein ligase family protein [Ktedonobacteraceae bacterium]|nr:biotin/lipoate A/B protein ligase family protein [Ktedonobacteraceae bacterium]